MIEFVLSLGLLALLPLVLLGVVGWLLAKLANWLRGMMR